MPLTISPIVTSPSIVVPSTPAQEPSKPSDDKSKSPDQEKAKESDEVRQPVPAAIFVHVPADTVLTFSGRRSSVVSRPQDATAVYVVAGKKIESKPTRRYFLTPDLTPGRPFVYQLEAQFQQNGRTVTVKKEITVYAGKKLEVSLGDSASTGLVRR